jgi:hypothetical protein
MIRQLGRARCLKLNTVQNIYLRGSPRLGAPSRIIIASPWLALVGLGLRRDTAPTRYFARLSRKPLPEEFLRYRAVRIADQQPVIANRVKWTATGGWVGRCCSRPAPWAKGRRAKFLSTIKFRPKNGRR